MNRLTKAHLLFIVIFSYIYNTKSQNKKVEDLKFYETENNIKLNYIPVDIQLNEIPMGVLGIHYDFQLNKQFYAGVGMFAAVTGDQGGLFTLGAEIGFQRKIHRDLYFDTDFHFGGGGGYRYLVRDGAYINYNLGLKYKLKKGAIGIQYSYFNFYNGYIESSNVSVFLNIPTKLLFTDYDNGNLDNLNNKSKSYWNRKANKNAIHLRFDHFITIGKTKNQYYEPITNTLQLLGFQYDHYLTSKTFGYIHLDAIYKGLESGFMDLFLGIGFEPIQKKTYKIFAKFGIGASGGRVEREGGFTVYPNIGIEKKIYKNTSLFIHSGYVVAPFGNFEAYTFGYGIKYNTFVNGVKHKELSKDTKISLVGIRLSIQNQTYFKAASTETRPYDLQLISIQLNQDISRYFYFTGQAAFTYEGEAGGYADGMIGIGYYSKKYFNNSLEFNLEALVGVSGGAKIDTGDGVAIKPKIGIHYVLNPKFNLTAGVGKIIAPFGKLNSDLLTFGFAFKFGKIHVKNK